MEKIMFKKLLVTLLAIAGMIANPAQAIFVYGNMLPKDDMTFILLGDTHIDNPNQIITEKQHADLPALACALNAYVLAEDLEGKIKNKPGYTAISFFTSPLASLGKKCKELN